MIFVVEDRDTITPMLLKFYNETNKCNENDPFNTDDLEKMLNYLLDSKI